VDARIPTAAAKRNAIKSADRHLRTLASPAPLDNLGINTVAGVADAAFGSASGNADVTPVTSITCGEVGTDPAHLAKAAIWSESVQVYGDLAAVCAGGPHDGCAPGAVQCVG
jgi:hypothetical protein